MPKGRHGRKRNKTKKKHGCQKNSPNEALIPSILKTFPDIHFDLTVAWNNWLVLRFQGREVSVLPSDTIDTLKAKINDRLSGKTTECSICYSEYDNTGVRKTVCSRCTYDHCTNCFVELLKKGEGIVTCPQCSFKIGKPQKAEDLRNMVNRIQGLKTDPACDFDRNKTVAEMELLHQKSLKLFELCNTADASPLNPTEWLCNQDEMITMWDNFKLSLENSPDFFKTAMLNSEYANYMNFMQASYPRGFGNEMKRSIRNTGAVDGAMLFHILKKFEDKREGM